MNAPHLPVLTDERVRPVTRGDCVDGERPCPWVSCVHHAIHGRVLVDDDAVIQTIEAMSSSCTLDVADEGGATLEEVGELFDVTRERIRQIEAKALAKLPRRSETMREHLEEEPSPELRPARAGAARLIEDRRPIEPPAQHATLPRPGDVSVAAQAMWCPWMGAAMTGTLCARRHTARREKSANAGAGPLYPSCASCADGAALTARVGRLGELVPLRVAVPAARIDWMGDGETETEEPPAAAEEPEVKKVTKRAPRAPRVSASNGASVTAPAADARCIANGCVDPPQGYREGLDPLLRPLCKRHRLLAQGERTKRQCSTQEAVAIILRRAAASNGCETAPQGARVIAEAPLPVAFDAPVVEAPSVLDALVPDLNRGLRTPTAAEMALRDERDWLLSQRDAARAEAAELRRDRDAVAAELAQVRETAAAESRGLAQHLDARDARIAELEGQFLADATSREPSPRPLARLAALAAVLVPSAERIAWTVGGTSAEDGRWCASALGHDDEGVSGWEAVADTPDEALAGLVRHVEGEAHARIEALTAALRGAR
ncbi:MAG: sigma factor-like helix-turn-helix DNA-binding protein [Polyangiales bacterium]